MEISIPAKFCRFMATSFFLEQTSEVVKKTRFLDKKVVFCSQVVLGKVA
jgi:hypothetical protein